jgi:hypothetical protein
MGATTPNPNETNDAFPAPDFDAVVERLAKMKEHESDRLEKYDATLLGCRITTLHSAVRKKRAELKAAEEMDTPASAPPPDDADAPKPTRGKIERGPSQVKKLLDLAETGIELFHDCDRIGYARACESGRIITAPIDSRDFKFVLCQRYFRMHRGAPNDESMKAAIRTLEARANSEGQQYEVALRVAQHEGCVYLNLARDDGSIVEVSPLGMAHRS